MSKSSVVAKIFLTIGLLVAGLLALLLAFTMGAAMFWHVYSGGDRVPEAIKPVVEELAKLPGLVRQAAVELRDEITGVPSALLIPKDKAMHANWVHKFPAPEDDGYLLLSGLSAPDGQSIIQLIRVANGQVLAKWIPDWRHIHDQISHHRFAPKGNPKAYRAVHPLLLSDGSLIFNTGNSLVRLPLCSSKPAWVLNYPYHHSIELSPAGNSVWGPSVTSAFATENPLLKDQLRDDSLAEISLDGHVIQNLSFSKILADNNLTAHMLGTAGSTFNLDPLHINQITPAHSDGPYWQRNDLLISARHTSTVYLYRPSTGKIIWHQQGPWLNQHSAHFIKDHAIAVFGNDVYGNKLPSPFINKDGHNQIYLHDFKTGQTQKLQPDALNALKPRTITEGRARVLSDMSIFIEETNHARLFKLNAKGQLIWSYINTYDKNHLGAVAWSRYITRKELHETVTIESLNCPNIQKASH